MADNREVKIKRGETGFVLNAVLKSDDGVPIELAGLHGTWTVTISITERGSSTINLLEGSAMILRDQITYPGQAYYVFTETDANLPAKKYDVEITAIEPGATRVHKFPKTPGSVFGTLHMMDSKE